MDMIATMSDLSENEQKCIQADNASKTTEIDIDSSKIKDWLNDMDVQSITEINAGEKNNLHNEKFALFLLGLCETLVLWSGINAQFFNVDPDANSSANVESYFKDVKTSLPNLPCRADEFLQDHIEMINGMIVDASQEYVEFVDASGGLHSFRENIPTDELAFESGPELDSESEQLTHSTGINEVFGYIPEEVENNRNLANETDSNIDSHVTTEPTNSCAACKLGDLPTGAHKCITCLKSIHAIVGCSYSAGQEEGYGEKRFCYSCFFANHNQSVKVAPGRAKPNVETKNVNNEKLSQVLNKKDKWSKSKRSQRSYLRPMPFLNLMTSEKKQPKIGFLSNASLSTTTHKIKGKTIKLKNTCAFDSFVQVYFMYSVRFCTLIFFYSSFWHIFMHITRKFV